MVSKPVALRFLMSALKRAMVRLVLAPGASALLRPFRRDRAVIFMLHRFDDPERGVRGHSREGLRRALGHLRSHGYELLSLADVYHRLAGDGPPLRNAVAFTIDDGYLDHATVAAPIFAEFDCPVTTFVATGFLDRELWFWWDKIEYIFAHANRRELEVTLDGTALRYAWTNEIELGRARSDFTVRCKHVLDSEKHAAILRLASAGEVDLPTAPPPGSVPMSWDQLRSCEARGMSFGPHTVTHPVLSQTPDDQSRWELTESWRRLSSEARSPVPVFCYPNGRTVDFGDREIRVLQELRLSGAVVGESGTADVKSFRMTPESPFRVCRYPYPESLGDVMQLASGLEALKQTLRGER